MSAFLALRDVSVSFEEDLKCISKEIFSAKINEPFEDVIVKRKKDLALYSSKLKLLQAKAGWHSEPSVKILCSLFSTEFCRHYVLSDPCFASTPEQRKENIKYIFEHFLERETKPEPVAFTVAHCLVQPQITNQQRTESVTITDYEDAAIWKLIEQQTVKTLVQTNAVKKLLSTPDRNLDPELSERKEKIISQLTIYKNKESELRHLQTLLQEKETELLETRQKWDTSLCKLKDVQKIPENKEFNTGPLYKKLQVLISKMELMRWLITKLVTSRTSNYDWTLDPHNRLKALSLARKSHNIYNYIES